ncbi:22426_t:CDS:2 [Cetraspora pellucida]|uniref:22426_t:CDS:1 n=1 Tax=Cetraspora pellucida TaxID=1433469 RepID=A0A9N8Z6P5_9GLOM|nr:22426_t:CDS:2 [Cetraspora pellucida]
MPKLKCKNAAKKQSRDNKERFSKTIDAKSNVSEYRISKLLIYKLENNKKELNNKIEPNKEESKWLINEDNSFYNLKVIKGNTRVNKFE